MSTTSSGSKATPSQTAKKATAKVATPAEDTTTSPKSPAPSAAKQPETYRPINTYAVVSLTAGLAALCGLWVPGSLIAIVTGHVALAGLSRNGERGKGSALFGLILGYLTLVFGIIFFVILIIAAVQVVNQVVPAVNGAVSGLNQATSGLTDPSLTDPNAGQ